MIQQSKAGWFGFLALSALAMNAHAIPMAEVELLGPSNFLQAGSVTNDPGSAANITKFVYSLGTPEAGIATWDNRGTDPTGRTIADPLSEDYFQTLIYDGLSIAPGGTFVFSGQDIDRIADLNPLDVVVAVDTTGTSLRNAFVKVFWSNGTSGTTPLLEQSWEETQLLEVNAVPEPSSWALLASGGAALALWVARRRRSKAGVPSSG